jgi:hypothetical protein
MYWRNVGRVRVPSRTRYHQVNRSWAQHSSSSRRGRPRSGGPPSPESPGPGAPSTPAGRWAAGGRRPGIGRLSVPPAYLESGRTEPHGRGTGGSGTRSRQRSPQPTASRACDPLATRSRPRSPVSRQRGRVSRSDRHDRQW